MAPGRCGQQLVRGVAPASGARRVICHLPAMKPTPLCPLAACHGGSPARRPRPWVGPWREELDIALRARASGLTTAKTSAQPQAVVELFTLLHQHRTDERRPAAPAGLPRLRARWRSRSTWCAAAATWCTAARSSGRFSAFSSFMVEKGFVRHPRARRWMIWPGAWTPSTAPAAARGGHSQRPRLPALPRRVLAD